MIHFSMFRKPQFGPKIRSKSSILAKWLFQQAPKFGPDPLYKPPPAQTKIK